MYKTRILTGFTALIAIFILAGPAFGEMQVRVDIGDKEQANTIRNLNLDIAYVDHDMLYVDIIADKGDLSILDRHGLSYTIVHEDITAFYQSRYGDVLLMGGYPTMAEAYDSLDLLYATYPDIVTEKDSIGYTIEGRPIYMVKISDNVQIDEDEPEIFINGLIHAREPGALLFNLYYMRYLCDNYGSDPLVTELVDEREFYFIPLVNPDGYEENRRNAPNGGGMWRKNKRNNGGGSYGVDLNRNWGYMWGYDDFGSSPDPESEVYRGTGPFSEPETQFLREFVNSREFITALNYHTYGGHCIYAYGYDPMVHAEDLQLLMAMGDTMTSVNGYNYGTVWQLLYPSNGDAVDWQYGERAEKPKIFSIVIECGWAGDGFWPPESRIPEINEENLDLALILSDFSDNPYAVGPPLPPTIYPLGTIYENNYTVYWNHSDTLNPGIEYELIEHTGFRRGEEGFEEGDGNWTFDGFSISTARANSGTYSLWSGRRNNSVYSAVCNTPLQVAEGDTLEFWTWYDIELDYDYIYVQVTTDGGATYHSLEGNITTNYNPNGANLGNGITGNSNNNWIEARFPLDGYWNHDVVIRFLYVTDYWTVNPGMYIDDLFPIESFENSVILSSNIPDTSYHIAFRDSGDYYYQVRAKDQQEQWSYYSDLELAVVRPTTSIDPIDDNIPYGFRLYNNYPNPFNASTNIAFSLPEPGYIRLDILNLLGEVVDIPAQGIYPEGKHTIIWNGTDSKGKELASGYYFYRLSAGQESTAKKMLMLK